MTVKKKSQAQLKRLMKRAQARGETYEPPVVEPTAPDMKDETTAATDKEDTDVTNEVKVDPAKLQAARKLTKELAIIEANQQELKAKERRSAKRKAEAIASEAVGCPAAELLEWYAEYQKDETTKGSHKTKAVSEKKDTQLKRINNPYIAFVGQLSFETTKASLFQHIQQSLSEDFEINEQTVRIRLLTEAKTKKSRGMAFLEVTNPELLYALLRLHQTYLEGRRINVERSAGGKAQSESRKQKIVDFRKQQEDHLSTVIDKMLQDLQTEGSLVEGELDKGVIILCKHHSANIVQAALETYVETNGRTKDNPSAYLTHLVSKFASEGVFEKPSKEEENTHQRPTKKPRQGHDSVLARQGVDMKASAHKDTEAKDVSQIFPSYNRGRGRGGRL
jgi:RNA recognition motif-containing protein